MEFNFKSYDNSKQSISYCEVDKCKAVVELRQQLNQLKEENIKFTLDSKKLVAQYSAKLERLKAILAEIKEIAEKMKKFSEEDAGELTECLFRDKQCEKCHEDKCLPYWFEQILQKISECEVEE